MKEIKLVPLETIEPTSTHIFFECKKCGLTVDWADSRGCQRCKGNSWQAVYKEIIYKENGT